MRVTLQQLQILRHLRDHGICNWAIWRALN